MIYAHIIHGVTFSAFWGWLGFFIPLGVRIGGHFCPVDMRTGLWGGAWMVGIWGVVEERWRFGGLLNKVKNSYYSCFLILFVDILSFRQIVLGFQTGSPRRPACCADNGYPV